MATSFCDVFKEINNLVSEGEIDVDGEKIKLDFFLGGDYKVIYTNGNGYELIRVLLIIGSVVLLPVTSAAEQVVGGGPAPIFLNGLENLKISLWLL
jgi:hypothetical protein